MPHRAEDGIHVPPTAGSSYDVPPPAPTGLQVLYEGSEPQVDIIAVHGLAANPDYAWVWLPKNNPESTAGYPSRPLNWLSELLPEALPTQCRIMTFNYWSNWIRDAPKKQLSQISDILLELTQRKRQETCSRDRPIIFIGHSFGGNVIEQAIVTASRPENQNHREISQCTAGIVFLGTPHRGCKMATLIDYIKGSSKLFPDSVLETALIESLKEHSDRLETMLRDFSGWLFREQVPVVCYFEQQTTKLRRKGIAYPFPKYMVVNKESACIDGHHSFGLDTDHSKINKYYGVQDPSFQLVSFQISQFAKSAMGLISNRKNRKDIQTHLRSTDDEFYWCLRAMNVTSPDEVLNHTYIQKGERLPDTCEWILGQSALIDWVNADKPQLLRLAGSPGIGKTMLSAHIVDSLKIVVESDPQKAIAHFFCDDKVHGRNSSTATVRSLMWQLLLQKKEFFSEILSEEYKARGQSLFEDFFALWKIFQKMLLNSGPCQIYILIDALDELEASTRDALFQEMKKLFKLSEKLNLGKFKVLLTSRTGIPDIERHLKGIGSSLHIDSEKIDQDLSRFIDARVDDLTDAVGDQLPESLRDTVRSHLKRSAEGTFLWVSLMVFELQRCYKHEILEKLRSLPDGLDGMYNTILQRIPEKSRYITRFILKCMIASRKPLTKQQLQTLFAIEDTGSLDSCVDLDLYSDIFSTCGSIIYLKDSSEGGDQIYSFCHQTFKDFVVDRRAPGSGTTSRDWYHVTENEANLVILHACWLHSRNSSADENTQNTTKTITVARPTADFLDMLSQDLLSYALASYPAIRNECERLSINLREEHRLRDLWLLSAAVEGEENFAKWLLENGGNTETRDENMRTPLILASDRGHVGVFDLLLARNADIRAFDGAETTPLLAAASSGHERIVFRLWEKGAAIDVFDEEEKTPIFAAAENGHEQIVRLLANKGATLNTRDHNMVTPLMIACESGHVKIVEFLIQRGDDDDVNARALDGLTGLSFAIENEHVDVARVLLQNGADFRESDDFGFTPYDLALRYQNPQMIQLVEDAVAAEAGNSQYRGQQDVSMTDG